MKLQLVFILSFFTTCVLAQAPVVTPVTLTQTVRGVLLDRDSRSPLVGATVQILKTTPLKVTVTDVDGKFRITDVPVGRQTIKITYLGYNDLVLNDVIVNSGKEVVLNLEMQETVVSAKEVVIKGDRKNATNNELISVSGRNFTIDQTQRYAGSLGDPSRMASNFAGVAGGGSDQRNDIVIRGNSPLGLLWRLEGADIPNPNHFSSQGANGGPVSILNNNVLANSDFITGAFPSMYGNANSGVFDLKMRNGNNEKHEYTGQIGFAGVELMAEGPINKAKGSSFLLSYRYSTLAAFDAIGLSFGDAGVPKYQDLSFKLNFPNTKAGAFSIFGIGGISSTQLLDSKKEGKELAEEAFPVDVDFSSRMGVAGVTHTYMLDKSSYIKTVITASGEANDVDVDSLNYYNNYSKFPIQFRRTATTRQSMHSFYNKKISARHSFRVGVIATAIQLNMQDTTYDNELKMYRTNYDIEESTGIMQAYANWNYRISEQLSTNVGVHYNQFLLNNTSAIEPRAGVKWKVNNKQSFNLGFGMHSQIQPLPVYFHRSLVDTAAKTYVLTNKDLKMSNSYHYILGYERQLGENLFLKSEVYYQHITNQAVERNPSYFSVANFGADFVFPEADSLVNKGKGRNYGLELTLERYFSGSYYFLVTASLFQSEYKGSDNKWRSTAFNSNYVFNALAGKEWKFKDGKNILALSLKVTNAGGKRYVPVDQAKSAQNRQTEYDEANAYKDRFEDYFRTDIRISYKKNGKRITQEWALDVQNVFNTQNVLTQQYNPRTGKMEKEYQIGIFPVPLYRIYF